MVEISKKEDDGKRGRIMLIDDDKDILLVFKKGLERNSFEVHAFSDSIQALKEFKSDYYDTIITDVKMPGLNGFELYRQIRRKDEKVKIFFLSAIDIYEHEANLVFPDFEPNIFIHKPIGISDLVKTIAGQ